jgi:hypothetical protein
MQAHRRIPRHHEIERGAGRPAIKKWCSEPAGRNSLVADKCDAHETARGVGLKLEQRANFFRAQIIGHSSLNIERQTSNVQRPISNRLMDIEPEISNSKNRTGVIDVIAHDPKTGEAVLVMNEPNEWDSSDEQLLSLQERFNAYVSFLLDGEMESGHPELAGKPARIEVRCAHMPDSRALELLGLIHDQLAFQEIKMELVILNDETRISNDEGMTKSE